MCALDSSSQPIAISSTHKIPDAHRSPEGLSPLEFAARVYNRVVILMVLYVLSIGPMYWQWVDSMHVQGHPAVARFYYPLLLACEIIPVFGKVVNWYLDFWV
jgi:hypothetical protein